MLSIIPTGAALIREREHGTLEHLLVMLLIPFEVMAAKVWANGLVVLVCTALSLRLVVQRAGVFIVGSTPCFCSAPCSICFPRPRWAFDGWSPAPCRSSDC